MEQISEMGKGKIVNTQILALIRYLQSPLGRTVPQLVEDMGVSRATIYRYLVTIQEMGLPLTSENRGREVYYFFDMNNPLVGKNIFESLPFLKDDFVFDKDEKLLIELLFSNTDATFPILSNRINDLHEKMQTLLSFAGHVSDSEKIIPSFDCYLSLCRAYSHLEKIDSAEFFIDKIKNNKILRKEDSISFFLAMKDLMKAKGLYQNSLYYNDSADSLAQIIESQSSRNLILNEEIFYENERNHKNTTKIMKTNIFIIIISTITILGIIILILLYTIRYNKLKLLLMQVQKNSSENEAFSLSTIKDHFSQLIEITQKFNNRHEKFYDKFLLVLNSKKIGLHVKMIARNYVNTKYPEIINIFLTQYPKLSDSDIDIICMVICKFDIHLIALFMGYGNDKSFYRRQKLILAKLETNCENLEIFLEKSLKL